MCSAAAAMFPLGELTTRINKLAFHHTCKGGRGGSLGDARLLSADLTEHPDIFTYWQRWPDTGNKRYGEKLHIPMMPLAVAALTSILSTPTPARATTRSFRPAASTGAVTLVSDRTISPW